MLFCCPCYPSIYVLPSDGWNGFWPQLIVGVISSVVGFAGAYFLFWKATQKEKLKELKEEKKESQRFLSFLRFYLERVFIPANTLATSFNKIVSQLSERKVQDIVASYDPAFNFKWFYDIDKTKLLKSFLENYPGTSKDKAYFYNQLLSRIDLMDNIVNRFIADFNYFISEGRKAESLFNKHKLTIQKRIDALRAKLIASKGDTFNLSDYEKEFMEAVANWYTMKDEQKRDMYVTYDNLISNEKLHKCAITRNDENLLNALRFATFAFTTYEKNKEICMHIFSSFSRNIFYSICRLKVIVSKMKNIM